MNASRGDPDQNGPSTQLLSVLPLSAVPVSPITCAFASVDDFDYNYRGGIYIDHTNATDSNHAVEVVGWGFDKDTHLKYWIARNSCQSATGSGMMGGQSVGCQC